MFPSRTMDTTGIIKPKLIISKNEAKIINKTTNQKDFFCSLFIIELIFFIA